MKTMTITATVLAAFAIAAVATMSSGAGSLDGAQVSQTAMPIYELMANATNLPEQSFDAF